MQSAVSDSDSVQSKRLTAKVSFYDASSMTESVASASPKIKSARRLKPLASTKREQRLGLEDVTRDRKLRSRGSISTTDALEFFAHRRHKSKSIFVDLIHNKPREPFPNEESDLSARGLSCRSPDRFRALARASSTALSRETLTRNTANKYKWIARRSFAHLRLSKFERAKRDIEECISLNPDDAANYYNRSIIPGLRKNMTHGIKDLTKAIKLNVREEYLENRALYYRQAGRFRDAIKDYKRLRHKRELDARRALSRRTSGRSRKQNGNSVLVRLDGQDKYVSKNELKGIVFNIKPMYRSEVHIDCMASVLRNVNAFAGIR